MTQIRDLSSGNATATSGAEIEIDEGAGSSKKLTLAQAIAKVGTFASASSVSDHLADTTDAHAASAISFTPGGTVAATNAQTAIAEVATDAAADATTKANAAQAAAVQRANHTGTQLASTISDFATAVAATAAVTANTAKVTNATHTGEVTGATALTIATAAVTNAKLANMATATIKGRVTAGTGVPEDLTATQARTVMGLGALATLATAGTAQIDNDAVTNAKAANMAASTIKGRVTASTGDPEDLTPAQARTVIDVAAQGDTVLKSLVTTKGDLIAATGASTPARLAVGTNGHVLTADSAEATGVKWAAAAGGGLTAQERGMLAGLQGRTSHIVGRYYPSIHGNVAGALAWGANQMSYVPLYVPATTTYDRIQVYSYGATANARLGIYASHATTGLPDALVLDAGVVSQIGAGDKTITISQSLTGGAVYWLACVLDATGNIMQVTSSVNTAQPFEGGGASLGTGMSGIRIFSNFTYGALPSTAPAFSTTGSIPAVGVRAS